MQTIVVHEQTASKLENFFINAIFLLNLFPFFKLIPFIEAEVQPIGAVFAAAYLLLCSNKEQKHVYKLIAPYIMVLTCYFLGAIILANYGDIKLEDTVQSLIIFISPLLIFVALFNQFHLISLNVFRFAIYAWFLISVCQFYFSALLNATGISFLLSLMISRFSAEKLADWDRGVVAFAPEPSYGAHIILMMFAFAIFFYHQKRIGQPELILLTLLSLFMVCANQSATMGFIVLIFVSVYSLFELLMGSKASKLKVICTSAICLFSFFILLASFPEIIGTRVFDVLMKLSSGFLGDGVQNFDAIEFTNSYGSVRTISTQVGYFNVLNTFGIGSGMGGWGTHFLDSLEQSGIELSSVTFFQNAGRVVNLKPYAYGALAAFDMGFLGLITLSSIFLRLLLRKVQHSSKISAFAWSCLVSFILGFYFNSPTSLPVYWMFFLLFLRDQEQAASHRNSVF
jgi:hypothetical protein